MSDAEQRISKALTYATWGAEDGAHHKSWVIDQMVRALTGCPTTTETYTTAPGGRSYEDQTQGESDEYQRFRRERADDDWDEGIAP